MWNQNTLYAIHCNTRAVIIFLLRPKNVKTKLWLKCTGQMLISVHFLGVSSYYCILLNFNITETVCHTVINTEFLIVFGHTSNELVVVLYNTQLNVCIALNMYKNIVDIVWNNICKIQYAPTSCDNTACCRLVYADHVRTQTGMCQWHRSAVLPRPT